MINIEKEIEKKFPKINNKKSLLNNSILKIAKKLIHEDTINNFLTENSHLRGFDFIDAVLEYFDFDYTVSSTDMENIPTSGKVVIIANHPLGGLDALCLLKLIHQVRSDVKIVANDFLAGFEALSSLFIQIDTYKPRQAKNDIKAIYDALENDEAIIIFPAGEVSRATPKGIKDPSWHKGFLNFAVQSNSPILPIYIDAKNSKTFYTVSILNKTFSTLLLSDEMFKKQSKRINMKIGEIIPNENIKPKGIDKKYLINIYKRHLYSLKKGKRSFFETQKAIAHPENRQQLKKELKKSTLLGETKDGKKIYLYANHNEDSIILRELGRLREISFRKVGEGANKKRDIDKYDKYYEHIILWDEENIDIVGSYRIGNANLISKAYGNEGFYTNTLFKFSNQFKAYLVDSIELGRSFVQPKYWGTRALDYLWYGIGAYLHKNPHIKYMFGPVSISANYPNLAKDLIIYYYSHYYGDHSKVVEAESPYKYSNKIESLDNTFTFKNQKGDFKILKSTLSNMGATVPTLYKQYTDVCDENGIRFLDFNVDKDFNDCVDGFILVEVALLKQSARKRYIDRD